MSKHSTLKATGTVGGKRSVLKRFERVKLMKERGQWKQGQSPIGLPKTKFEARFGSQMQLSVPSGGYLPFSFRSLTVTVAARLLSSPR